MKTYTFDVVETDDGSGDLALQLTEDFTLQEDWREGDVIEWIDLKNGCWEMVNRSKENRNVR